mgnify:CR=1 FL=1
MPSVCAEAMETDKPAAAKVAEGEKKEGEEAAVEKKEPEPTSFTGALMGGRVVLNGLGAGSWGKSRGRTGSLSPPAAPVRKTLAARRRQGGDACALAGISGGWTVLHVPSAYPLASLRLLT